MILLMILFGLASPRGITFECFPAHYERLIGTDERIVSDVLRLACNHHISVIEGVRTKGRQKALVKAGKSWTMNSKHLRGDAVDLYLGSWDCEDYRLLHIDWKKVRPSIVWGGNWRQMDCVHFEL